MAQMKLFALAAPEEPKPIPLVEDGAVLQVHMNEARNKLGLAKLASAISLVLVPLWTFGMPYWSWVFNDVVSKDQFGPGTHCNVPASQVRCAPGWPMTYEEAVQHYGLDHRNVNGTWYACGCSGGWVADWVCPVNEERWSISLFIQPAPGTGAMAAVSFWPMIVMWTHGPGSLGMWKRVMTVDGKKPAEQVSTGSCGFKLIQVTLFVFQVAFGLFLVATDCVLPQLHIIVCYTWAVTASVHYLAVAAVTYSNTLMASKESKFFIIAIIVAAISFFGIPKLPVFSYYQPYYTFWFAECVAMNAGFLMSPLAILILE